jgi:hypothetical protein
MRRLPSASSLERAFACPASQAYPHLRSIGGGGAVWSQRGRVIHRFLERVPQVGREKALEEVPSEYFDACDCIELERLPALAPNAYAFEVAFAYDLEKDTARELGRGLTREAAYALATPDELVGTTDVVGVTPEFVVVCDYKTGYRYFDAIEENAQLMFYALAACRTYGRTHAMMAIIRIDQDGHPYFLWAEVTQAMLEAFVAQLRAKDEEIAFLQLIHEQGGELEPVTGEHCRYCPAVHCCRAWMTIARNMTNPDGMGGLPELNAETAAQYVVAIKTFEKVLKRVKTAVQLYATQNPIDMEGGWFYGKYPFPRNEWNVEKALPILRDALGAEASAVVDVDIIKKRIEAVFRERRKTDKAVRIGKDTEALLERCVVEGALTIRYSFPVGEHKWKPEYEALMKLALTGGALNGEGGTEEAGDVLGDVASQAE